MSEANFFLDFDNEISADLNMDLNIESELMDTDVDEYLSQMPMPDICAAKHVKNVAQKRFSEPVTEAEKENFGNKSYSESTKRKTSWVMNVFYQWIACRNELQKSNNERHYLRHDILNCSLDEINNTISLFIIETRKENGQPYPRETLFEMVSHTQIFFNMNGQCYKFMSDPRFSKIKNTLDNRMKELAKEGNIRSKVAAQAISEEDEEKKWSSGTLGTKDPETLLNTVIYLCGVHFSLRGIQEHKDMKANSQIQVKYDQKLRLNYLLYTENSSKNNQGGLKSLHHKPKCVPAYENVANPERCIVKIFRDYMSRRPHQDPKCSQDLYLRPLSKPKSHVWYTCVPIGIHSLHDKIKKMCAKAGITAETGRFTNHSLRATGPTWMFDHGIDEQLITELTGHRSVAVRNYKRSNPDQKLAVSNLLYNNPKKAKIETCVKPPPPQEVENENTPPPKVEENTKSDISEPPLITVQKPKITCSQPEIVVRPVVQLKASELLKVGNELQIPKVVVKLKIEIVP